MTREWDERLLTWFDSEKRAMPWRDQPSPYRVWISEIMLQQTQVETVRPYYTRFLDRLPDVASLASVPTDELLKLWEGLGYYSRARNLQAAARRIMAERQGRLPETYEEWRTLPGIGPYTAAAIASIAYGLPEPVVDGNVLRVWARFRGLEEDIKKPATRTRFLNELRPFVSRNDPSRFNQAMMELGALVCRPKSPLCAECPLNAECVALRDGRCEVLPVRKAAARIPHVEVVVGVIRRERKVLIAKRPDGALLGGLWEFVGGKPRENESLEAALIREVREECGLEIRIDEPLITLDHAYSHFSITLHAYLCTANAGEARPLASQAVLWVAPENLRDYPFPKANLRVLEAFAQRLAKEAASD